MSDFYVRITDSFRAYNKIRKKFELRNFRLTLNFLVSSEENVLYITAKKVLEEIDSKIDRCDCWQNELLKLYDSLNSILSEFIIVEDKVINPRHEAARRIVEAIQIIELHHNKIDYERLSKCVAIVKKHGSIEQREMLTKIINKHTKFVKTDVIKRVALNS